MRMDPGKGHSIFEIGFLVISLVVLPLKRCIIIIIIIIIITIANTLR